MERFLLHMVLKKVLSRLSVISWSCPPQCCHSLRLLGAIVRVCSFVCGFVCECLRLLLACLLGLSLCLPLCPSVCLCVCLSVCLSSSLSAAFAVVDVARVSFAYRAHCFYVTHFHNVRVSPSLPLTLCALSCQPPLPLGERPRTLNPAV